MFRRSIAALLFATVLCMSQTACIGQMALVGKVMEFNLEVSQNKWGRELVFLVLYIIPVYPIASAIDLLIVNSIEFHTGTNPLTDEPRIALRDGASEVVAADGTRAAAVQREDGSVEITAIGPDGDEHRVHLVPVPGGIEARDGDGGLLGRVDGDGTLHSEVGPLPPAPRG